MAWAIVENDQVTRIVNVPTKITINGVSHPKSIFTAWNAEDLINIGIFPYTEDTVDNRYYNSGNPTYSIGATSVTGTYEGTAKDVDQMKDSMISQVRSIASSRLAQTDWMVIRATEGGTAVPEEVTTYRAAVRTASNDKETAINALNTIADVIAFENQAYVEVRKVVHTEEAEDGTITTTYGPETEDSERTISGVTGLWPTDPLAEEDPAFVSLTAAE
jgi:hypothetical protein